MSTTNAIVGVGTRFRKWDLSLSTPAWTDIAEVTNIDGPNMTKETVDVTSLDTTDRYRKFIAGFIDPGTVKLSMNFTRESLDAFKADFESMDAGNYEIVIPDSVFTSLEFEGIVQELPMSIPTDKQIMMDVTIKVTGKVVVNSGASSSTP